MLDNSGSMRKNDPRFLTKEAVARFVNGVPNEARLSVVIFDKQVRATPLGSRDSVNLAQFDYRGPLTNIPAAVARAIQELKLNGRPRAARSIVLLTDGVVDTGTKAQDREVTHWLRGQLASDAASTGVKIFTVALGTGSDRQLLQELAQRTGGRYFWAQQAKDLPGIFAQVSDAFFAPAVLQAPLERAPQLAQVSPRTPAAVDPAPSNLPQAVSPTARSEKASTPPSNAPTPEPEPRADTGAPAPLVVPSQPPSAVPIEPGAPGIPIMYGLVVIAALLMGGMLALVAVLVWKKPRVKPAGHETRAHPALPDAFLLDLSGVTGRKRHQLGTVTVVGRNYLVIDERVPASERNHIVIDRPTIGRVHAVVEYKHRSFWLVDQNSKNGTYVNGNRVNGSVCLTHGDQIQFHDFAFEFALAGMSLADATVVIALSDSNARGIPDVPERGLDKPSRLHDSRPRTQTTNPATTGYGPQEQTSSRGDGENESDPNESDPDDTKYEHHQRTPVRSAIDDTLPNERTVRTSPDDP